MEIEAELLFDLWLISLTLIFSSFAVLFGIYLKSRGTPLGRNALYIAIGALIWSIAGALYSASQIVALQFGSNFLFLGLTSLAGVSMLLGAYERARIQVILTRSGERELTSHSVKFLTFLPLILALTAVINLATGNSFSWVLGDTHPLTVLSLILVSISLVALFNFEIPKKIIYVNSAIIFALALSTLVSYYLNITALTTFLLGTGSVATAKALIITSLALFLTTRSGLKAWIIKINLCIGILFMIFLAIIGLVVHHPGFFSLPTVLSLFLVGALLFWHTWRLHSYKAPQLIIL